MKAINSGGKDKEKARKTHKKVPPLNSNSTPVHHLITSSSPPSPPPPPNILTTIHVPTAPTGAAIANATKCALAPLFPNPCLSKTLVSPNAAGALCTMIAKKMMRLNPFVEWEVEDAPRAMPSAAEWMQRPRVVEEGR